MRIPFLAFGRTLIDVHNGELTMRVNDQQITFNIMNALKFLGDMEECSFIEDIDELFLICKSY